MRDERLELPLFRSGGERVSQLRQSPNTHSLYRLYINQTYNTLYLWSSLQYIIQVHLDSKHSNNLYENMPICFYSPMNLLSLSEIK
jgi:hypothetical protein